eukprot:gene5023-7011_t
MHLVPKAIEVLDGYFIAAIFQAIVNFFALILIISDVGFCLPLTTGVVYAGIVLINVIELGIIHKYEQAPLQLFINIFGYYGLLRFWTELKKTVASPVDDLQLKSLGMLHILFTISIIACTITKANQCTYAKDNSNYYDCSETAVTLNSIESLLEMLLLGYLGAIIDLLDKNLSGFLLLKN